MGDKMNQPNNDLELDILRKEYEMVAKSIDDLSKNMYSLFPAVLAILSLLAGLATGPYKIDGTNNVGTIINLNRDPLVFFTFACITVLMFFWLLNLQEITKKTIYKEYLENQINHKINKSILLWDSKVVKQAGLSPYSLGIRGISGLSLSTVLIIFFCSYLTLQITSNKESAILQLVIYVIIGLTSWYIIILTLPKRLNKILYSRKVHTSAKC